MYNPDAAHYYNTATTTSTSPYLGSSRQPPTATPTTQSHGFSPLSIPNSGVVNYYSSLQLNGSAQPVSQALHLPMSSHEEAGFYSQSTPFQPAHSPRRQQQQQQYQNYQGSYGEYSSTGDSNSIPAYGKVVKVTTDAAYYAPMYLPRESDVESTYSLSAPTLPKAETLYIQEQMLTDSTKYMDRFSVTALMPIDSDIPLAKLSTLCLDEIIKTRPVTQSFSLLDGKSKLRAEALKIQRNAAMAVYHTRPWEMASYVSIFETADNNGQGRANLIKERYIKYEGFWSTLFKACSEYALLSLNVMADRQSVVFESIIHGWIAPSIAQEAATANHGSSQQQHHHHHPYQQQQHGHGNRPSGAKRAAAAAAVAFSGRHAPM